MWRRWRRLAAWCRSGLWVCTVYVRRWCAVRVISSVQRASGVDVLLMCVRVWPLLHVSVARQIMSLIFSLFTHHSSPARDDAWDGADSTRGTLMQRPEPVEAGRPVAARARARVVSLDTVFHWAVD